MKLNTSIRTKIHGFCIKHRRAIGIMAIFFVFLVIYSYIYTSKLKPLSVTLNEVEVMHSNEDMEIYEFNTELKQITQSFYCPIDEMAGIGVPFYLKGTDPENENIGEPPAGSVQVTLKNLDTNEIVCSQIFDLSKLAEESFFVLNTEEIISGVKGQQFEVLFSDASGEVDRVAIGQVVLFTSPNSFVIPAFNFITAFILIGVLIVYYLIFYKRAKIETIFIISVLFIGTIYCLLITPYVVPDEQAHVDSAYRVSNQLLGIENIDSKKEIIKREEDGSTEFTRFHTIENYRYVYENINNKCEYPDLVRIDSYDDTKAAPFLYGPSVLGLTAARLLNWGVVPSYLFARWCSLLFFAVMTYFAMKKIPFGKITLFIIALLPMTLQEAASFSYDSVINTLAIFFTCYCFSMAYKEEKIKKYEIAALMLSGIGLIFGKGGAYFPLVLIAIIIPFKRLKSKKLLWISCISFLLVAILAFAFKNLSTVTSIGTASEKIVSWSGTEGYTLNFVLHNFKHIVILIINTFWEKAGFYLESLVGSELGWFQIKINFFVILGFYILLALSLFKKEEEKKYITAIDKMWIGLMCIGSIGLIFLSMLLSWTPLDYSWIEGVQGRYFLPLLFSLLMLFRNNKLVYKSNIESGLCFSAFLLQICSIVYILFGVM